MERNEMNKEKQNALFSLAMGLRCIVAVVLAFSSMGAVGAVALSAAAPSQATPPIAAKQEQIGTVIVAQGETYAVDTSNNKRPLQRRSDIFLHDTITTEKESKVQVRLNDDSVIVVQPSSRFSISEFAFNKNDPGNNRYVGNIVKGALINVSGQGNPENYQLKSPLTAISFRGTGISTKLVMVNDVAVKQHIQVFKGAVEVASLCTLYDMKDEKRRQGCVERKVVIGAGQDMNAVTVGVTGSINEYLSSSLSLSGQQGTGGKKGVAIRCKTNTK
jgi:hypothetical protein